MSAPTRAYRLAVLVSHPIQYFSPLYRRLAAEPDIDLTVYYCSRQGLDEYLDAGFGERVRWDIPLLDGYASRFLPNLRRRDAVGGFFSLINPTIVLELWRRRFDAVWIHGHGYATHLLAVLAGRALGVPVLMRGETHLSLARSGPKRLLRSVLMRALYNGLCSVCLPIGTRNREFYRSLGVPDDRMALVPYAVDNDYFRGRADLARPSREETRRDLGVPADRTVILYASKLTARKRPLDLLRAYADLRGRRESLALLFVGSGEAEAELRDYVSRHEVPDVYFAGFRNQSELPRFYVAADVFVLPSENEPWGLVINEVMCAGLPVVTTEEVGAAADLVRHGDNGFLFPTGDVPALARALDTLCGDRALRERMGARSLQKVADWGLDRCVAGARAALELVTGCGTREQSPARPLARGRRSQ